MNNKKKIRLGLVGLGNWALFGHIRVLKLLPEYEITTILSQRAPAAREAAEKYGIRHVVETLDELVNHPEVDMVLVLTTSQQHEEGVRAAIEAGKDVYCEWPLTPTAELSSELAQLAREKGVQAHIGLQRPFDPAFRYVHDLIEEGYVGKIRSVSLQASVTSFGPLRDKALRWSVPVENFMSVVAIFGGHFLPVLFSMVGRPATLSALIVNQFPDVIIKETGEKLPTTAPDQLMMTGTLEDGGIFSFHVEGGKHNASGFQIDITGTDGDLKITNESAFYGFTETHITGAHADGKAMETLAVPEKYERFSSPDLEPSVIDPGDLYVALASDLNKNTHLVPTFDDAVWLQQLLELAAASSESGRRVSVKAHPQSSAWPSRSKASLPNLVQEKVA